MTVDPEIEFISAQAGVERSLFQTSEVPSAAVTQQFLSSFTLWNPEAHCSQVLTVEPETKVDLIDVQLTMSSAVTAHVQLLAPIYL